MDTSAVENDPTLTLGGLNDQEQAFITALSSSTVTPRRTYDTGHEFQKGIEEVEKAERLLEENQQIENEIHALKTNPSEIEKVAREKLNLVKPKDMVFQFIRASENKSRIFNKS